MNYDNNYTELPEEICETLLMELFRSLPILLKQIAPDGFANSPLVYVHHPSAEQHYEEYRRFHFNLVHLQQSLKQPDLSEPLKSFEAFEGTLENTPVEEQFELVSIFGKCLWNAFSNNHTVHNKQGEAYDLGSWRGTGGFIADVINKLQLVPGQSFNYMDFYMGGIWIDDRADLPPVYEFIFTRLKEKDLDWEYSFPRMGLVSFKNHETDETKPEEYDALKAVEQQLQQQQKEEVIDNLQQQFDNISDEEYEKAKYKKPSQEVMAYFNVYGHWPKGHPLSNAK